LIKKCTFTIPKTVPKEAADLISKLLKKVPDERLGAKDIQDVMSHPFFMDIDFEKISSSLPPQKFELNKV
jgi:serine/threonine protein kinase